MPTPPNLVDRSGRAVRLDRPLASGGEGTVYSVDGLPDLVVKVYSKPPSRQTAEKLFHMVELPAGKLREVAAWPCELVYTGRGGALAGFVMPRVTGFEPIHHLYNPAQRLKYFPRAGWNFQVRAAYNCAAAFDEVHKAGCLVGDVNQSNLLVSPRGLVRLIDCDSFQVRVRGVDYPSEVGVAHYTPPELQGATSRGMVRTENHDRFGLAVLLFQLLFVGRHPYAGVPTGPAEVSFEDAIREYRFAYGPDAASYGMAKPPAAPGLDDVPPDVAGLFRRAFERGSDRAGRRPAAGEWLAALLALTRQLTTCTEDEGHTYWAGRPGCVWCRIAAAGGPDYFFGVADPGLTFAADDALLREVVRKLRDAQPADFPYSRSSYAPPEPPEPEPLPDEFDEHATVTYLLAGVTLCGVLLTLAGVVNRMALLFGLCITVVFGVWLWLTVHNSPLARERRRRREHLRAAERELERLEAEWEGVVRGHRAEYDARQARAREVVARCRDLPRQHADELRRLTQDLARLGLRQHLQSCFIADATIPKIGDGRKQTLAAYNIHTAYDVDPDRVLQIRGFGEGLTAALAAWRDEMARQFRFDPTKGVPEADLRALAAKYKKLEKSLLAEADRQLAGLAGLAPAARERLKELVPDLRTVAAEWAAAEADWDLVRPRR